MCFGEEDQNNKVILITSDQGYLYQCDITRDADLHHLAERGL